MVREERGGCGFVEGVPCTALSGLFKARGFEITLHSAHPVNCGPNTIGVLLTLWFTLTAFYLTRTARCASDTTSSLLTLPLPSTSSRATSRWGTLVSDLD